MHIIIESNKSEDELIKEFDEYWKAVVIRNTELCGYPSPYIRRDAFDV